jgi:uncharacterized protein involved in exopolysaccharide biosynthesis
MDQLKMTNEELIIIDKDEIDLVVLWKIIWNGKVTIILITAIFSILSVLYALYLPNIYKADAVLYPSSLKNKSFGSNNTSGLQGIANLAGVNIGPGGETSKTDFSLAVLQSRKFITAFINKHKLTEILFALNKWNEETGKESFDSEIYDINLKKWQVDPETNESLQPTELEAYYKFTENLSIISDLETGIVVVSIEFISPVRAKEWMDFLIEDLNEEIRNKDVALADKSILYLQQQIEKTKVADIQNIFFTLIEQQIQTKLLAETKEEYAFEIIDPPVIDEIKTGPKRALICLIISFIGGLLSIMVVFIRHLLKLEKI